MSGDLSAFDALVRSVVRGGADRPEAILEAVAGLGHRCTRGAISHAIWRGCDEGWLRLAPGLRVVDGPGECADAS